MKIKIFKLIFASLHFRKQQNLNIVEFCDSLYSMCALLYHRKHIVALPILRIVVLALSLTHQL